MSPWLYYFCQLLPPAPFGQDFTNFEFWFCTFCSARQNDSFFLLSCHFILFYFIYLDNSRNIFIIHTYKPFLLPNFIKIYLVARERVTKIHTHRLPHLNLILVRSRDFNYDNSALLQSQLFNIHVPNLITSNCTVKFISKFPSYFKDLLFSLCYCHCARCRIIKTMFDVIL